MLRKVHRSDRNAFSTQDMLQIYIKIFQQKLDTQRHQIEALLQYPISPLETSINAALQARHLEFGVKHIYIYLYLYIK